jgi:hypothetical protein
MRILPQNYLNTDAAKDKSQQGFDGLRNYSGRIGFNSCSTRGPGQNEKLIPLPRLTAFRPPLPSSRGHLARQGWPCCSQTAFQKLKRPGSTEEVSLNHLAGIGTFIEGCGRIDSISEEIRKLVASCWPDLVCKLLPKN